MGVTYDAVWTGSASSLFTTAGNWSPANVPTVGEDIMIPAGTPAIDCTGMSDTAYGVLTIQPGHTGDIGSSGASLISSFTKIDHRGSGKLYFTNGAATTALVRIRTGTGLGGSVVDAFDLNGASITRIEILRGAGLLRASMATLASLYVGYVNNIIGDVRLTLDASSNAITELIQDGGSITSTRLVTRLLQKVGQFRQKVGQAVTTADVAGEFVYESNTTITTLRARGGSRVDLEQNRNLEVTVTNSTFYPGSRIIFDPATVVFSSATEDLRNAA